jgi:hypothetical protein
VTEISMALRSDGTLLVWGDEGFGLRGAGIPRSTSLPVPTQVTPVPGVTMIALSGSTVLVQAPVVTMPNVVGTLRVSAVAQRQALGLSVKVTTVPDQPICNNVGTVESQTHRPAPSWHRAGTPRSGSTSRRRRLPLTAALTRPGTVPRGPTGRCRQPRAERSWCLAPVTKEDS